jgi:acetyl esterase/lipase
MASTELEQLVAAKRANPYTDDKSIEELRADTNAREDDSKLPPDTRYRAVNAGGTTAEWIEVGDVDDESVFYFIHGGGYYRGTAASARISAAFFSQACGVPVCSVNYRLAPEHPFPAALDDVVAGYQWVLEQGYHPSRVVVGGISAGGGLAAALLLWLKGAGQAQPAGGVPLSPWVDLTQSGASYETKASADPVISKAYLDRMAAMYIGERRAREPMISPVFGDLSGLAPQLIQVGSSEVLLDDSVQYAARLAGADVWAALEVWPEAIHGWHGVPSLPESDDALASIARFFHWSIARATQ